ncbi:MAG: T9SS type A sorting domain-containing protein [Ignavibacteria bacterium]|jgi:hypothetical protein|nr:T9SS type A sorting domain-containing protein [Ignavibacteria bacterium]
MKKTIKISGVLFLFFIIFFNSASAQNIPYRQCIPDVMNYVNVYDNVLNRSITYQIMQDSMPVFPGFPVVFSGYSYEGSLFCNMDNDTDYEIVMNSGYNILALNLDGTNVPGWPKTVSPYAADCAPAFGDIDGDGFGEVVVTTHGLTSGGYIYAFKRDGTPLTGFPINHGYTSRTPVLADMNNDGKLEIIVNLRTYPTGSVYIYKYDGTILTGWPKAIGHVPASSAAVGDINGDNVPEVIMESYTGLYAWTATGDSIPGFPFMLPNGDVNSYSSPVLADLDGDNKREIIFGSHVSGAGGYVYVLKQNGTVMSGWPKTTGNWIYGPPAVGFVNNDNILDIVVGDQIASMIPTDYVYGWDKNGNVLSGFPIGPLNAINCQVVLGDLDNDTYTELMFDDNTQTASRGKYLIYNHDGTLNFIQETDGTSFFMTPCLTDINRNGTLDIIGAGVTGTGSSAQTHVYLWNAGVPYTASRVQIPVWQYNSKHNGIYGMTDLVSVGNEKTETPSRYALHQNYPNPFNPATKISFDISKYCLVKLEVYDINGKLVSELLNEYKPQGKYEISFNAYNLTSGTYFAKLTAGGFSDVRKMILIK